MPFIQQVFSQKTKWIIPFLLPVLTVFSSTAFAVGGQSRLEVPSSFNPVGSGARALGWGGAFIAVADDATAASWNPGGLIQLRNPEVAVVGNTVYRSEDNTFGTNPQASGKQSVNYTGLNYFSASMPCGEESCGRNMIFSINYQKLYNLDRNWSHVSIQDYTGYPDGFDRSDQLINLDQKGDLYALGLAWAMQATETLSVGLTLNFWNNIAGTNGWRNTNHTIDHSLTSIGGIEAVSDIDSRVEENYRFKGFNMNLGLMWQLFAQDEQKLTLGVVIKTPFKADIHHSRYERLSESYDGAPPVQSEIYNEYNEKLNMPLSFGLGLAWQLSDNLTLAGDVYRTNWNNFEYTDFNGNKFSPISSKPSNQSDISATYQVRFGGEYRIISQEFGKNYIIPLRAGIFYDPAPAEGSTDNYYGISIGGGIAYATWVFDIAWQYRFGNNVNTQILTNRNFSQDVAEHTLYGSVFYRF